MLETKDAFRTLPRLPAQVTGSMTIPHAALRRFGISAALFLAHWVSCAVAGAQTTKTFIDYFQPTPITCSPLSSATWGVAGVLPRDTCNGIESANGAGVSPSYYYWDGSIIRAPDGTYHLFADRWPGASGFNPGWESSDPIHAVSSAGPLGPFTYNAYVYSDASFGSDPHHGHNSMACTLLDGTYCFVVSEVVPFTIFTSSSLNGPWTPCSNNPGAGLSVPAGFGGNTNYGSNVSLVVRPDGNFEIIQRHGLIALSTTGICGPYKAQQPTNTYPASEAIPAANSASIYPNKTKHSAADPYAPSSVESTYTLAEDPVIWYSGGKYHVLYDYPDDRVGYHLTSVDGIHNWTDEGLAYDPRLASKLFSYVGSTTVNQWNKMERPGVLMESGHITHVTFAVSDVDKNSQIPAGSNHGSKVIVVPFDGVTFDTDTGAGGGGGTGSGGASSTGGTSASGGTRATDAGSTAGGTTATGGNNGTGGTRASTGGLANTGGTRTAATSTSVSNTGGTTTVVAVTGGRAATGGVSNVTGGAPSTTGGSVSIDTGGKLATGGVLATGGAPGLGGSIAIAGATSSGTNAITTNNAGDASDAGGCGCRVGERQPGAKGVAVLGALGLLLLGSRRRRPT